jgi:hypothetical protein
MKIPSGASHEVQQAFREVWQAIERTGGKNIDLKGTRIINAGRAEGDFDYVTKADLQTAAGSPFNTDPTFNTITVRALARVLGTLYLPRHTDGTKHHAVLFVDSTGAVAVQEDGPGAFDLNLQDGWLELGYALRIKWIAGLSSLGVPADGVMNVLNNAANDFARFVLGLDDGTGLSLTKNGTTLEIRVGGGGALTNLTCAVLTANSIASAGGAGTFATVVIGVDPGGGALLRVGGDSNLNGNVDGNSYSVNGNPGVDFGPGAIASITIEKGLVTAAS